MQPFRRRRRIREEEDDGVQFEVSRKKKKKERGSVQGKKFRVRCSLRLGCNERNSGVQRVAALSYHVLTSNFFLSNKEKQKLERNIWSIGTLSAHQSMNWKEQRVVTFGKNKKRDTSHSLHSVRGLCTCFWYNIVFLACLVFAQHSRKKSSESSPSSSSSEPSSSDEERESRRSKSSSKRAKKERKHKSKSHKHSGSDSEEGGGPLPLSRFFGNVKS